MAMSSHPGRILHRADACAMQLWFDNFDNGVPVRCRLLAAENCRLRAHCASNYSAAQVLPASCLLPHASAHSLPALSCVYVPAGHSMPTDSQPRNF
jgi:hypothetical protein